MEKEISAIKSKFFNEAADSRNEKELYDMKVKYTGRNGELTKILKNLKNLPPEEQRKIGPLANEARRAIEQSFEERKKELSEKIDWEKERLDVTRPGKKAEIGHLHPITLVYREVEEVFSSMGFEIVEGPELETGWYNFTALNFPFDHPARDMQDTF